MYTYAYVSFPMLAPSACSKYEFSGQRRNTGASSAARSARSACWLDRRSCDTLVAADEDLAMIGTLCAAFVSLNPNSVMDVDDEKVDGEKVLHLFLLYRGSHDRLFIDCLLSC